MEIFLVGIERTEDKYGAKSKRAMRAGRRPGKAARYSFSSAENTISRGTYTLKEDLRGRVSGFI
jgi:hypothetical protein